MLETRIGYRKTTRSMISLFRIISAGPTAMKILYYSGMDRKAMTENSNQNHREERLARLHNGKKAFNAPAAWLQAHTANRTPIVPMFNVSIGCAACRFSIF